jgi:hypothetical protein
MALLLKIIIDNGMRGTLRTRPCCRKMPGAFAVLKRGWGEDRITRKMNWHLSLLN